MPVAHEYKAHIVCDTDLCNVSVTDNLNEDHSEIFVRRLEIFFCCRTFYKYCKYRLISLLE